MGIELNKGQRTLIKNLTNFIKKQNDQLYTYSGPAGSGKTTVIREALDKAKIGEDYMALAYVGKAVLVLLLKGMHAKTIHSFIYRFYLDKDEDGKQILRFVLKDSLVPKVKLIIVDEGGMVNDQTLDDILSFGVQTIMMGDMNQLGPVFGSSKRMMNPDYTLTEVMRQSLDNPIIWLSQEVLKGHELIPGAYGTSRVVTKWPSNMEMLNNYDIILTCKNATRDRINDIFRYDIMGLKDSFPIVGDRIICRQNVWDRTIGDFPLTTGSTGTIADIDFSSITKNKINIDFKPDFIDGVYHNIEMGHKYIQMKHEERKDVGLTDYVKFEYGYAMTTHMSQGSEYKRVLYIDEPMGDADMRKRLKYTAITRAVDYVHIVKPMPKKFVRGW